MRAAYRLAAPATNAAGVSTGESASRKTKALAWAIQQMLSPNRAQISAVTVEYGLYGGRFWLPRQQFMEGEIVAAFARVPVRYENAFSYASVNQRTDVVHFDVDTLRDNRPRIGTPPDSLRGDARKRWLDSATAAYRAASRAREDSVKRGLRVGWMRQCDTSATRTVTQYRYQEARLPVQLRVPCSLDSLTQSADLPASIYDSGEEIFGAEDRDELLAHALAMGAQAPLSLAMLPPPSLQVGPSLTRYNRVEGFSTGLGLTQQLGAGYSAALVARLGVADLMPNLELSVARSNLTRTLRLNGYRRLVSANDWGNPLSFGSALSAFLFGRDEAFYYRAGGAELLWTSERGARLDWRVFAERQSTAEQETNYSVSGDFEPNIVANEGVYSGASARFVQTYGMDPHGARLFTDLRVEGAHGDSTYGRAAVDLTLTRDLARDVSGALTAAGGTSVGHLPVQRRWFLGGTPTVRGQSVDSAQSGSAFWLARGELARPLVGARVSLFGDLGWVGDRTQLRRIGRPMSGAGIGLSGFDGLIRLDLARGFYPREQTRVNLYLDARF